LTNSSLVFFASDYGRFVDLFGHVPDVHSLTSLLACLVTNEKSCVRLHLYLLPAGTNTNVPSDLSFLRNTSDASSICSVLYHEYTPSLLSLLSLSCTKIPASAFFPLVLYFLLYAVFKDHPDSPVFRYTALPIEKHSASKTLRISENRTVA